jgi:hypothetical protein
MPPRGAWRGSSRGGSYSAATSRLKPVSTDPLDDIGLPSKGETRLNDLKKQEAYFAEIRQRLARVTEPDTDDLLMHRMKSLHITDNTRAETKQNIPWPVLFAMRKLREAIVATRRTDQFSSEALCFMVRAGIMAYSIETYQPTLVHLLHTLHPKRALSAADMVEFTVYYVLDLACRQGSLNEAFRVLIASSVLDKARLQKLLNALAAGNWARFWRAQRGLSTMERIISTYASDNIRANVVLCLQKSYFTVPQAFVERCLSEEWPEVCKRCATWQLEGNSVVVRRAKAR